MSDDNDHRDFIHRPHDALFQRIMSDALAARELINCLPADLRECIDQDSVQPINAHFIEDRLRHLYSDCVLAGRLKIGGEVRIYLLVEHQSTGDPHISFRFLQYKVSAWDMELRQNKGKLPLIIPVLVYNGKGHYPYSLEFKDLIEGPQELVAKYLFCAPTLLALNEIHDNQLAENAHLGAALIAMKHAYDEIPADHVFKMVALFKDPKRRLGYAVALFSYIITTGNNVDREALIDVVNNYLGQEAKEGVMTIAQQLIEKGREEGREEALMMVAEKMLVSGFDLETIMQHVDLPMEDLLLLKERR